jgi:large subunit ribosomal protein L15
MNNVEGARHRRIRVGRGRGSGKGKTSGKGHKGQMARSGHKHKKIFEGGQMPLVRRLPKRGFNNPLGTVYTPVNLSRLAGFDEGAEIDLAALRTAGLANGTRVKIKILGYGDLEKKLTVKAHAFSASARQKIEAAGGTCEVVR